MRRFYRTLARLSEKLPCKYPVYIYFTTSKILKDCYGDANFTGKSYSIRIVKGNWDTSLFVLLHEYAHCRADWSQDKDGIYHGEEWARQYGLCWQVYCGEK
jgi:hypothetical protein